MKPFNLEKALKHPELVRTRSGIKVKALCDTGFDCQYPISALLEGDKHCPYFYAREGNVTDNRESGLDLFMIEEKTTFYVNIYRQSDGTFIHYAYESEELARGVNREIETFLSKVAVAVPFTYEVE